MLRSYWRIIIAAVGCLAAGLIIASLLQPEKPQLRGDSGYQSIAGSYKAGGAGCEPSALQRFPKRDRQSKANTCAEAQEQQRTAANGLIEATRQADAADEGIVLAYKQTRIAAWEAVLGFLTLIAAGFAAWYARQAAFETWRSANSAEEALTETRRSEQRQARAYLYPESVTLIEGKSQDLPAYKHAIASVIVKNSGATPAHNVHHWNAVVIVERSREIFLEPQDGGPGKNNSVPRDGVVYKDIASLCPVTDQESDWIKSGICAVYVYGRITYWDIFGEKRWTNYRLKHGNIWPPPDAIRMVYCAEGNDSY